MFVVGMRNTFTEDGFLLIDMPSGRQISTEAYSEFVQAFEVFRTTKAFEEKLRAEVGTASKPLLFVEGKNDRTHLETAWSKLYPNRERPFDILSVGDYGTGKKNDAGGSKTLKLMLELLGRYEVRPIVGLFDNDRAGAEQFTGLSQSHGYSNGDDQLHRRHAKGFIHAQLLPVPPERTDFAPDSIPHRMLELEHYYSDEILQANGVPEALTYSGAKVFEIKDSKKAAFAEAAKTLSFADFVNFSPLFTRLLTIFGIPSVESAESSSG